MTPALLANRLSSGPANTAPASPSPSIVSTYEAGNIHANSDESMWAVHKRGAFGTWHYVSVKDLARYVNDAAFRLNEGNVNIHTLRRMSSFLSNIFKDRITYKWLVGVGQ